MPLAHSGGVTSAAPGVRHPGCYSDTHAIDRIMSERTRRNVKGVHLHRPRAKRLTDIEAGETPMNATNQRCHVRVASDTFDRPAIQSLCVQPPFSYSPVRFRHGAPLQRATGSYDLGIYTSTKGVTFRSNEAVPSHFPPIRHSFEMTRWPCLCY